MNMDARSFRSRFSLVLVLSVVSIATAKTELLNCSDGVAAEKYSVSAGEPLDIELIDVSDGVVVILGPVGHYPSAFMSSAHPASGDKNVSIESDVYNWAKAGKLTDWFTDAAGDGVQEALRAGLKAAMPEAVRAVVEAYEFSEAAEKHQLEEKTVKFMALTLAEVSGGYAAKVVGAFALGGLLGAANSEKGEVGLVAFKVRLTPAGEETHCAAAEGDWEPPKLKFRVNSPLWHPYGDYQVFVIPDPAVGSGHPGYSASDLILAMADICGVARIPAIAAYGSKPVSWRN